MSWNKLTILIELLLLLYFKRKAILLIYNFSRSYNFQNKQFSQKF